MDFHTSEKPAPKGVRIEDFEESDVKDLAGLLPGVARDDGLPRLMGGYPFGMHGLPAEGPLGLAGHGQIRIVAGVHEDEVGDLEVWLETPDEPNVLVRDDLGTRSDCQGVRSQGLLPTELESVIELRSGVESVEQHLLVVPE